MKRRDYRIGVNYQVFLIFYLIIIPNLRRCLYSEPHDILRIRSQFPILVAQVKGIQSLMAVILYTFWQVRNFLD